MFQRLMYSLVEDWPQIEAAIWLWTFTTLQIF